MLMMGAAQVKERVVNQQFQTGSPFSAVSELRGFKSTQVNGN